MLQARPRKPGHRYIRGQRVRVSDRTRIRDTRGLEGTVVLTWRTVFGRQWCIIEIAHNCELTVPSRELDPVPQRMTRP